MLENLKIMDEIMELQSKGVMDYLPELQHSSTPVFQ